MVPNRQLMLCVLALLACGVFGCKNDLSTPKGAARAFAKAMEDGDAAEAKRASTGGDPQIIEAMAKMTGNMKKLHDASVAKFGDQGKSVAGGGGNGPDFSEWSKKIDEANVKEEGDTATLTQKDGGEPMKLKKVNGEWKVDTTPLTGEMASMGTAMIDSMSKAAAETADDIKAGKYKTAQEAQEALGSKMMGSSLGKVNAPAQPK
jgi:hypothetical protein